VSAIGLIAAGALTAARRRGGTSARVQSALSQEARMTEDKFERGTFCRNGLGEGGEKGEEELPEMARLQPE
jgi:hypothetical protein